MPDDESLRDDAHLSEAKRELAPDELENACPVCGAPYDFGSSGVVWPDEPNSTDVRTWVRLCHGPVPGLWEADVSQMSEFEPDAVAYAYVHKDEHLDLDNDAD